MTSFLFFRRDNIKAIKKITNLISIFSIIYFIIYFFPNINLYFRNYNIIDKVNNIDNIVSSKVFENIDNTYDEYNFDSEFYPYYGLLDNENKKLYRQIYYNILNYNNVFVPNIVVNKNDVSMVIDSVMYDHPELFWIDNNYSYKFNVIGKCLQISINFNDTIKNIEDNKNLFNDSANKIIEEALKYSTDLEREKYVHDKLVSMLVYDEDSSINQSAFSALVNHKSVCAGFSKAFQYIMQKLSIPCYYVTGDSFGNHAWNIIKIDDHYYNVDLTFDNTSSSDNYFNGSDYEFNMTHLRSDLSKKLPVCE